MNNSGCYNCKKRFIGCHINCESYEEYKRKKDVIKNNIKMEKIINEGSRYGKDVKWARKNDRRFHK